MILILKWDPQSTRLITQLIQVKMRFLTFFRMFIRWSNQYFVPYIRILISWTCENVKSIFLFGPFADSKIFEAIGSNSSTEVSIEMFFVNIGLSVNVICCMFVNFLMRHIDGKYRSATAHLVQFLTNVLGWKFMNENLKILEWKVQFVFVSENQFEQIFQNFFWHFETNLWYILWYIPYSKPFFDEQRNF